MPQTELLRRIEKRLAALPMSERKAVTLAGVGADFIRDIRRRGYSPKAEKLARLAVVLKVPLTYLTDAVSPDGASQSSGAIEPSEQSPAPVEQGMAVGEADPKPGDPIQDLDEAALVGFFRKLTLIKKAALFDRLGFAELPSLRRAG